MPVPSAITDLSQTAGSNYPAGSESPTTIDDYLRAHASFLALLRDGKGLSAETDVASAGTCDIGGANTPFVRITGTTTITSFGTNYNGPRFLRFAGALTLTHNATSLILPGAANITTAAGDTCIAVPISGGWVVSGYKERAASETVSGVIELATSAETAALTDTARAIVPANLEAGVKAAMSASGSAPVFGCRAWVNFDGTGTVAIRASGNVSSITDNGTGDYTINFTTAMEDANYAVIPMSDLEEGAVRNNHVVVNVHTRATGSVRILTSSAANNAQDHPLICLAIFR